MRLSSLQRISFWSLALALAAPLAACTNQVVSGIGGGGGTSPGTGGTAMTTGPGTGGGAGGGGDVDGGKAPSADVIAIRYGDIPTLTTTGSAASSSGSGSMIDPNATELVFASQAVACGAGFWSYPCNSWRVSFILAPALLTPGTIDFASLSVLATMQETESPPGSGQCGGGGGDGPVTGTLEILAVDATSVTLRITGLDLSGVAGIDINGDHTALRCPAK